MPNIDPDTFESDEEEIGHEPSNVEQAEEAEDQMNGELDDAGEEATGERPEEDEELDDDEEHAPDEYVVEAILDHRFTANDSEPYYKIKWEGFNKKSDQTWEPQANLFPAARQLLTDYHNKIGGSPQPRGIKKRKSVVSLKDSQTPEPKRSKRADSEDDDKGYTPKGADWDKFVYEVQTIEKNAQTDKLDAYIAWKNGRKSKVGLDVCYKKLPQSMLKFYEAHLKFS